MTATGGQARKADLLRQLHHDEGILTLVNVWDAVSARVVAATPGTTAIATASASIAASHGYDDGEHLPLELMIAAVARITAAVDLPVTADLEHGYGNAGATTAAALEAGAVGLNLEDAMDDVETMQQCITDAVDAGRRCNVAVVVNARTDVYLLGEHWDPQRQLAEAVTRGHAYLAAGADCVLCPDAPTRRTFVTWSPSSAAATSACSRSPACPTPTACRRSASPGSLTVLTLTEVPWPPWLPTPGNTPARPWRRGGWSHDHRSRSQKSCRLHPRWANPGVKSLVQQLLRSARPAARARMRGLYLAAEGRSNAEIAAALFLSEATVRRYLSSTFNRLDVRNRVEAALLSWPAR